MIYKNQIPYIALGSLCGITINAFQFSIAKNRKYIQKISELENENILLNEKILKLQLQLQKPKSNW
jgi:hypothetical protein